MELGRSGDRADVDFAWRSGGPATAGRGEVGGVRRSIDKFRGTDTAPRHPSSHRFPACETAARPATATCAAAFDRSAILGPELTFCSLVPRARG